MLGARKRALNGSFSKTYVSFFCTLALIQLGSGCTSGHFLCGLSRLSPRSIAATATFFSVAVVTHLQLAQPGSPSSSSFSSLSSSSSEELQIWTSWPDLATFAALQVPAVLYAVVAPWIVVRVLGFCQTVDARLVTHYLLCVSDDAEERSEGRCGPSTIYRCVPCRFHRRSVCSSFL